MGNCFIVPVHNSSRISQVIGLQRLRLNQIKKKEPVKIFV